MNSNHHTKLEFISLSGGGRIARLCFNRPELANAFSAEMMGEITTHLNNLSGMKDVRALILMGKGKHFSAGADLGWMKASANLTLEENKIDTTRLREMFESIVKLTIPKIAAINGAAYGGSVGVVACCDYAIASANAKFCLSEAKLGLIPAVIAPYLLRKMHAGSVRRMALTGRVLSANEAREAGLVEIVTETLDEQVKDELNAILTCGPQAQSAINELFDNLREVSWRQSDKTVEAIARARTSAEGQAGLNSFFAKKPPPWLRSLD